MVDQQVVDLLLASDEPVVVWKTRRRVLGEAASSLGSLRQQVVASPRVQTLLARLDDLDVYAKWQGAHWILATLADLGYPLGDKRLEPVRDRILDRWLATSFFKEFEAKTKSQAYAKTGVPVMEGRHRHCASQQGNALWFLHSLALADERCDALAERLLHWQWPDGGWNCDRNPAASKSSFFESLLPIRGLIAHAQATGNQAASAARRAAEVFLQRRLFKRLSEGETMTPEFTTLHYPLYWHYDILAGLLAMADVGVVGDPRCADALELLESKRLPDGGWPAERKFYAVSNERKMHADWVGWGGTSKRQMNPWVTMQVLALYRKAGL